MKIVALIAPNHINKVAHRFFEGVVETTLELGHGIRTNGNGGMYNPANVEEGIVVHYAPDTALYEGLHNLAPAPSDQQKLAAYQKAMEVFPNLKTWDQESQDEVLRDVWTIFGQNLDKPADIIFILPTTATKKSKYDNGLYTNAIKIAKASGIPIKEFKPKRS